MKCYICNQDLGTGDQYGVHYSCHQTITMPIGEASTIDKKSFELGYKIGYKRGIEEERPIGFEEPAKSGEWVKVQP
jgi:hypothetical protein